MKKFLLFSVSLLIACNNPTETKNSSDLSLNADYANSIYKHLSINSISELHVLYYKPLYSSESPVKTVTINNADTIKKVASLLKALPDTGQTMVKFGSDAFLNKLIIVDSDAKSDTITLIGNRIKTPATSFYNPVKEEENALVKLIIDPGIQKSLQSNDSVIENADKASFCSIDFQSGFDSSFTSLYIDNQLFFEDTLASDFSLSLAKQVPVSISKGIHTFKCVIDDTLMSDTMINVPDSLVIGIRIDPQIKIPEFNLYKAGNFPYYD